jgi:hypothetical protein
MDKPIWHSLTFWTNAVGGLLIPVLAQFGIELTVETISTLYATANILLRLKTQTGVALHK